MSLGCHCLKITVSADQGDEARGKVPGTASQAVSEMSQCLLSDKWSGSCSSKREMPCRPCQREDGSSRERLASPHLSLTCASMNETVIKHLSSATASEKSESGYVGDLCEADIQGVRPMNQPGATEN